MNWILGIIRPGGAFGLAAGASPTAASAASSEAQGLAPGCLWDKGQGFVPPVGAVPALWGPSWWLLPLHGPGDPPRQPWGPSPPVLSLRSGDLASWVLSVRGGRSGGWL